MKLLASIHLQNGIHIQEPCSIIQPIWCFFHSWLKFTVGLNKVAPVVCDCGPYFMLYFVLCMYFIDFSSKDIKSMPSLHSQARAADLLSIVCSSIQWHVMPKKLLLCAVHKSAVLQTFVAFWSVAVKISFMAVNSFSIRWTSVFLHMTVLPPLILSMSFLNEGCSTKEHHQSQIQISVFWLNSGMCCIKGQVSFLWWEDVLVYVQVYWAAHSSRTGQWLHLSEVSDFDVSSGKYTAQN